VDSNNVRQEGIFGSLLCLPSCSLSQPTTVARNSAGRYPVGNDGADEFGPTGFEGSYRGQGFGAWFSRGILSRERRCIVPLSHETDLLGRLPLQDLRAFTMDVKITPSAGMCSPTSALTRVKLSTSGCAPHS
jgi:hypothetical protein